MEDEVLIDNKVLAERNEVLKSGDMSQIYHFITTHSLDEAYPLIEYLWKDGNSTYNLGYADYVYHDCYNDLFYGKTVNYSDVIKMRRSFESIISHQDKLGSLQFLGWFLEKSLIHQNVLIEGHYVEKDFGYEILSPLRDLVLRANKIASQEYPNETIEIMDQLPEWLEIKPKILTK